MSKARLGSISNQLQQQLGECWSLFLRIGAKALWVAMAKVTGTLQKSTEIMKMSNALVKLPQISKAMREMSMEMTKVRRHRGFFGLIFLIPHRLVSWRK